MKRKAILAMVMAICMTSAMVGCGNSSSGGNDDKTTNSASSSDKKVADALPTELTDNLYDYRVKVGNDVFTVPISLAALQNADWSKKSSDLAKLSAGGVYDLDYKKDKTEERTLAAIRIENSTDKERDLSADADKIDVTSIAVSSKWNDVPILLPKGIEVGISTTDDVATAYGEPKEVQELYASDGGNRDGYIYSYYQDDSAQTYKDADAYVRLTFALGEGENFIDGKYFLETVTICKKMSIEGVAAVTLFSSLKW